MVDWNRIVRNLGRGMEPTEAYREAGRRTRRERNMRLRHADYGRRGVRRPSNMPE